MKPVHSILLCIVSDTFFGVEVFDYVCMVVLCERSSVKIAAMQVGVLRVLFQALGLYHLL